MLMDQSSRDDTVVGVRPPGPPARVAVSCQSSRDKRQKRSPSGLPLRKEGRPISDFEDAVCAAVARLSRGEVATYGEIAAEVGRPGAGRAVGSVLAKTDAPIPWWRVVTSTGRLVPGHEAVHARLLRAEGVLLREDQPGPPVDELSRRVDVPGVTRGLRDHVQQHRPEVG